MQIRKCLLVGDRPCCPVNPKHPVHHHSKYFRYKDCNEPFKSKRIPRFICEICKRTISVLPDDTLPYRAVSVPRVQESFDAKSAGKPEPAVTENERGCLKRAWARFRLRVEVLCAVLGQMIKAVKPSPSDLWNQLRRQSNLERILHLLSGKFKRSLLGDYQCLQPWSGG